MHSYAPSKGERCWAVFLLGSASYLPGVLVLAHSLRKHQSRYPLIVLHDDKVPRRALQILSDCGLELRLVASLLPSVQITSIAERFANTWTKLQVWSLTEYERVILIDGDMMLRRNIDELFDLPVPWDWIASAHGCICNLDGARWAPKNWHRGTCGYTGLTHPEALITPPAPMNAAFHEPYRINSGLVILTPSAELHQRFLEVLHAECTEEQEEVASWLFPDQDCIGYIFRDRWLSLPWVYNAIKVSRYWHGSFWRDEYCANVHYICGKPWREPPSLNAKGDLDVGDFAEPQEAIITGHGCDTVTHSWWWYEFYGMVLTPDDLTYVKTLMIEPDEPTRRYLKTRHEDSIAHGIVN